MNDFRVDKKVFPMRLKEIMDENNENTYTLAELLHLSPATISRYASGDMSPKITTIQMLAMEFNINPAWLMGYDVQKYNVSYKESVLLNLIKETGQNLRMFSINAGVPYNTLKSILVNGINKANYDHLVKISKALDISIDKLSKLSDSNFIYGNEEQSSQYVKESSLPYYVNEDTQEMIRDMHMNHDLKILFDASRKLSTEDLKAVIEIVNRLKKED